MDYEITKLREHLFKQEKKQFIQGAVTLLDKLAQGISTLKDHELARYENSVKQLGAFLSMGDYLAVADILKYEIVPLFEKRG